MTCKRLTALSALVIGFCGFSVSQAWAASVPSPVFAAESLIVSAQKDAQVTPTGLIKGFYAALVETMKQGDELGFRGRYGKLEPVVKKSFNLQLMLRFAVGSSWTTVSKDEQDKMVEAFSNFSVATYASRFTRFHGELFEVTGEKPAAQGGVIVETKLTPKGETPVVLNYLVRNDDKGQPRIVDVYLDASISELATRRSEYSTIIRREGFPALISMLVEKNKKMGV